MHSAQGPATSIAQADLDAIDRLDEIQLDILFRVNTCLADVLSL
jgi:hypothetical protein